MTVTSQFFQWWFLAWNIGGWVVFFLFAVGAIAWIIYDTATRRVQAVGWLIGAILPALLLVPSALAGISLDVRAQMQNLLEVFFYVGLIGSIVPVVVAVGYGITYKGTRGCEKGHIYDASLTECPICAQERQAYAPPVPSPAPVYPAPEPVTELPPRPRPPSRPRRPDRAKANAWLVDEQADRTYQLYQGDTRIGRGKQANDIVFTDRAISREHVLIREEQGHFTIYDRASKTGTYINSRRIEGPLMLDHDDVIEIGDTRLRFMTSRR
jgi:hypothetical protein